MRLTRRYRFSASHRLHTAQLTPQENADLFGKCNNPHGHGHNYVVEVTVEGGIQEATGRTVAIGELDRYVQRHLVDVLDHRHLNDDVAEFKDLVPTTENLATVAAERLQSHWQDVFPKLALRRIHIQETERNSFELVLP